MNIEGLAFYNKPCQDEQKVAQHGDLVYRQSGAWSSSVHELLKHLEQQEFAGAPRVMGSGYDEQGREVLSYLPGETVHPQLYSTEAMVTLGILLRQLHQCSACFTPPPQAQWQPWFCRDIGTPDIIGHGDIAPWNIVTRQSLPVGLIDWEYAGPIDRLTEIAYVAWTCAQLYDDDLAEKNYLPDIQSRMRLVSALIDAYKLASVQRKKLTDRLIEVAIRGAAAEVIEQNISMDTTAASNPWAIAWRTRSAAWMLRNQAAMRQALQ